MTANNPVGSGGSRFRDTLYESLDPRARAQALGIHVAWSFPEQGLDPADVDMALVLAGVDKDIVEKLTPASAQTAFTIAMKYATGRIRTERGVRRLTKQHLNTAKGEGVAGEEGSELSTYALNIAQVEGLKTNELHQAGMIGLNPVTGEVLLEYSDGLQPDDYELIDSVAATVKGRVAAWTGKYTRETLNKFFKRLMEDSSGFYWVVQGNSWFVPNIEFGDARVQLSANNPVEVVMAVARVLCASFEGNSVQVTPIFPDPCSDVLSPHLEIHKSSRRALEVALKEEMSKVREVLLRDDNSVRGFNARTRALEQLKAKADLYARVLGAEMDDISRQVDRARELIHKRSQSQLGLDARVVESDPILEELW